MKAIDLDILGTSSATYDKTKITRKGRLTTKTIESVTAIGPIRNRFFPFLDDSTAAGIATTPNVLSVSSNNRVYVMGAIAAGLGNLGCYEFDPTTGTVTLVGFVRLTFINSPATTHTIRALKIVDSGTTGWKIFVATTGSVTANGGLYMAVVDKTQFTMVAPPTIPTATASGQNAVYKLENSPFTQTQSVGLVLHRASTRIYLHNGVSATHQYHKFNYSNSIVTVGANGITTDLFEFSTGNLPALTGTLFQNESEQYIVPGHSTLSGFDCAFFSTSTNAYAGKLSELTSGATTWPSLITSNYITPLLFTNPTPTSICWMESLDRMLAFIGQSQYIIKPLTTNTIDSFFGELTSQFYESGGYLTHATIPFGTLAITQVEFESGWAFALSTAVSQRGVVATPIQDSHNFSSLATGCKLITRVLDTPNLTGVLMGIERELKGKTAGVKIAYRTSNLDTDFDSETSPSFTTLPDNLNATAVSFLSKTQFQITFPFDEDRNTMPPQLSKVLFVVQKNFETSDFWRADFPDSVSSSPARAAFSQVLAYTGSKHWEFFAYVRDTGALFIQRNTQDHPSEFEISTNDGTSYAAISGAIASSPLLNVLRYKFASPPGVKLEIALREKV